VTPRKRMSKTQPRSCAGSQAVEPANDGNSIFLLAISDSFLHSDSTLQSEALVMGKGKVSVLMTRGPVWTRLAVSPDPDRNTYGNQQISSMLPYKARLTRLHPIAASDGTSPYKFKLISLLGLRGREAAPAPAQAQAVLGAPNRKH
jgi:hypothetical protein